MSEIAQIGAKLIKLLEEKSLTLATCESLTGGGIGATLTAIPGASKVYRGGFITYASDLKVLLAGVDAAHVATHGVINAFTAKQMAIGAAKNCRADIGLAVTGVAGPDSQDGAPVGEVWIGLARRNDPTSARAKKVNLEGDRNSIRRQTIQIALEWVLQFLASHA